MSTAVQRASVAKTGARPVKGPSRTERARQKSLSAFRKVGDYIRVRMETLEEGDVIATAEGTFCIVHKEPSHRGSMMSVRNVVSRSVHRMRFNPRSWSLRVRVDPVQQDRGRNWTISIGDVVMLMADLPQNATVLVRHARTWMPAAAPWLPLGDAEVLLALKEGRARILRNSWRAAEAGVPDRLALGAVVATRNSRDREPSVYLHAAPNRWVSNSRGAELSSAMIRHELRRRTYEVLKPPEIAQ